MGEVVNLRPAPVQRVGIGPAKCLACGHTWEGDIPLPIPASLECPSCKTWRAIPTGNWAPPESYAIFTCNCGSTVYQIVVDRDGKESTVCVGCGTTKL